METKNKSSLLKDDASDTAEKVALLHHESRPEVLGLTIEIGRAI